MKLALLLLGLTGIALASKPTPKFQWLPAKFSDDGVPLLSIDFHDGGLPDVALLKYNNPLPRQPTETEESIDKCIYIGFLRDEPTAPIAVTGCPFSGNFEITVLSKRHSSHSFKVSDNVAATLESPYRGQVNDIALHPPTNKMMPRENPPLKASYGLSLAVNFDYSFSGGFGGDEGNTIRRVVDHAQAWYYHESLFHSFTLSIDQSFQVPEYIEADENSLNRMGGYNGNYNTNVYMAFQNSAGGTVGIAWVGTICSVQSYRTAVVEWFNSDSQSGEIWAHEVGHNLGMNHDFNGSPGNPRYDSQGNLCTDIGGVMDYYQTVTRWSSCSVEDFEYTDHSCL